jgi:hypothetical protein
MEETISTSSHGIVAMPRRKSRVKKPQPAIRTLQYVVGTTTSYLDMFRDLSAINRKLMRQGHSLVIEKIEGSFLSQETSPGVSVVDTIVLQASVAGDSWPVHNAHVKGKALWDEMNQLVLEDNPSVKGKWHDFKVILMLICEQVPFWHQHILMAQFHLVNGIIQNM